MRIEQKIQEKTVEKITYKLNVQSSEKSIQAKTQEKEGFKTDQNKIDSAEKKVFEDNSLVYCDVLQPDYYDFYLKLGQCMQI